MRAAQRAARQRRALTHRCSARKLTTVDQDNRREYVAHLGLTTERGQLGARKRIAGYEVVMSYSGELGARAAALAVPQLCIVMFTFGTPKV